MKIHEIIIEKIEEGGGGGAAAAFNFKQNPDPAYDKPIDWKKFRKNSKRSDSDNDTVYGRREDGFVLSPVDPNRPKPVRKRAKWKDEEAKRIQADNAALKKQGKPGGREQGFLSDAEVRTIPASDKAKRSLYMPHYYTKNLGNKEKSITWKQQGNGKEEYTYKQKPGLIDPNTGKQVPLGKGSHDIANTKMVGGTKKTGRNSPHGNERTKSAEVHMYDPSRKDTWRYKQDSTASTTKTPGHEKTDIKQDFRYGPKGMFGKDIAAAKAKRAATVARPKVVGSETSSTSFGNASDVRKPVVKHKKIGQ